MSKPLRVLQIVPSLSLVYGGPSQMVLGLSQALAQEGVAVTVLTTNANGDAGQPPLAVPIAQPIQQDGYQVRYFRCAPFRRYKFSLGLLRWLAAHAREFDAAHIHALFSPVSSAAAAVARQHHLPYLLRPLGTLDPADLQKKRRLKQIYARLLERSNLAGARAIHFTSAQEAAVSERFGVTTPALVMPIGVEAIAPLSHPERHLAAMGIPDRQPRLLFLSRLDPKKGLDLLLPALQQLVREGVEFHWVLAGANPQDPAYEQQLRAQIQASPLADRTTLTGFVAGDRKAALLQTADLFVLPSYYENFGIAVAEAMAAALPVVVSDQVHIADRIQHAHAGWVCACNVTSLTSALRSALQDSAERQQRGLRAQQCARQHFSWQAIAQEMIRVYEGMPGESEF